MKNKKNIQPKLKIKKGDTVKVIAGAGRAEGLQGRVLEVYPKKMRVTVEGVNIVKKHQKPSAENPQGKIQEVEAPIHISNVMLIDNEGNASRVGRRVEENKIVRYSKKSDKTIK